MAHRLDSACRLNSGLIGCIYGGISLIATNHKVFPSNHVRTMLIWKPTAFGLVYYSCLWSLYYFCGDFTIPSFILSIVLALSIPIMWISFGLLSVYFLLLRGNRTQKAKSYLRWLSATLNWIAFWLTLFIMYLITLWIPNGPGTGRGGFLRSDPTYFQDVMFPVWRLLPVVVAVLVVLLAGCLLASRANKGAQ